MSGRLAAEALLLQQGLLPLDERGPLRCRHFKKKLNRRKKNLNPLQPSQVLKRVVSPLAT
jgi:hypothetical protein